MGCEDTPEQVMRCQKIRLHPTAPQARTLRKWMAAARKTYNLALRLVKDKKAKPDLGLKKLVVTARKEDNQSTKEMKQTPADIRVRAVLDLIHAFKSASAGFKPKRKRKRKSKNKKKRRRRNKRTFNISYKSRRLTSDSFGFETKSIKVSESGLSLFSKKAKHGMREPIRMSELVAHPIESCCRVQYDYGRWYLLVPFTALVEEKADIPKPVALDPGGRTFVTYYSETTAGEIGVQHKLDPLATSRTKTNSIESTLAFLRKIRQEPGVDSRWVKHKINRLRRAWYRSHARTSNLVDDLHGRTIKFLLDEYNVVIAPRLNVQWMTSSKSNLHPSAKDRLKFLKHGQFRRRLVHKAEQRGKMVHDLHEYGTSKTCSLCGNTRDDLGSSKVYECLFCGSRMDRDVNAAKNHLLKFFFGTDDY
jgi:putative transposase